MCSVCDNSYDPWDKRLTYFGDMFDRIKPDLVGLQELIFDLEVDQILAEMPGYAAVYYKGDGGDFFAYPDAVVVYRTDRFDLVESGVYWLSPTPDVPWSMGYSEGQSIPRIVVWVHLHDRDANNKDIYFATTHFDSTHPHQENAAPQMIQTVEPWAAKMPVIQTGDFNSEPRDPAYNILTNGIDGEGFYLDGGYNNAPTLVTNQDPVPLYDPMNRIDHILTAGGVWFNGKWTVDLYKFGDVPKFPSDHRLIWADLEVFRDLNCRPYQP
jgi:endonuclease/exonuclease/phosphatase family metal-dependent hydrolase